MGAFVTAVVLTAPYACNLSVLEVRPMLEIARHLNSSLDDESQAQEIFVNWTKERDFQGYLAAVDYAEKRVGLPQPAKSFAKETFKYVDILKEMFFFLSITSGIM